MFIQFHTDNHINVTDEMSAPYSEVIANTLERYSHQISSVQVHLTDENAAKGGGKDKRCVMEARLDGMEPVAVTGRGASIEQALKEALNKMKTTLETRRDRLRSY